MLYDTRRCNHPKQRPPATFPLLTCWYVSHAALIRALSALSTPRTPWATCPQVPGPGTYYVAGPIHMKANVDLHVAAGATLKFSSSAPDFLKEGLTLTRFEGP